VCVCVCVYIYIYIYIYIYTHIFHLNSVVCRPDANDQLCFCGYETWNNKETWKWYCI